MAEHRIYSMSFAKLYPAYVQKAERKQRTRAEVDELTRWLTGYDQAGLEAELASDIDVRGFFDQSPAFNANPATPSETPIVSLEPFRSSQPVALTVTSAWK